MLYSNFIQFFMDYNLYFVSYNLCRGEKRLDMNQMLLWRK